MTKAHNANGIWKIIALGVGLLLLVVGVVVCNVNRQEYTATQIEIDSLPADIKERAEVDLKKGGAYFYRSGEREDLSYVLLTFGNQLDLDMEVAVSKIDDGLYFSINPVETEKEEQAIYKLYQTDAPSIGTDRSVLENPRLGAGTKGINVGYVVPTENGLHISPLEDDALDVRVYGYDGKSSIGQGLYRFSYQITKDGARLISASAVDQYSKLGYVNEIDTDAFTVDVTLVGEEAIRFKMAYDNENDDLIQTLQELAAAQELGRGILTFYYDEAAQTLTVSQCKVADLPIW